MSEIFFIFIIKVKIKLKREGRTRLRSKDMTQETTKAKPINSVKSCNKRE